MTLFRTNFSKVAGLTALVALTSTVAFGLPWDIDMADSQAVKAYEREMTPLPEGVVPQKNILTPTEFAPNYSLGSPELATMKNPLTKSDDVMVTGERMFGIYCTPCHGDGQNLGRVAELYPAVPKLAGPGGRLSKTNEGRLYVAIRNGFGLMPSYGWAMNETEIWSLAHYVRTMDNGQYVQPAPPKEEAPQ